MPLSFPPPKKSAGCYRKERTPSLLFTVLGFFKTANFTHFGERNGTSAFILEDLRIWAFPKALWKVLRFITIFGISLLSSCVQQRQMLSAHHGCSSGSLWRSVKPDLALSPGVLHWPPLETRGPKHRHGSAWLLGSDVFFFSLVCSVLRTSQEWKFPTKYLCMEKKKTSQSVKHFRNLFIWELQHFMGVTQLCRMRFLRSPCSKIKLVHCDLFSTGHYFFPYNYSDNCQCSIFLLLFY